MLSAQAIVALQDAANAAGHGRLPPPAPGSPFEALVLKQHMANFSLWHEEDRARDPEAPDSVIASVKHSIDRLNQVRNDLVEQMDMALLEAASQNTQAALHSETPGLIIDRLSILSLKIFHTREESRRAEATDSHRQRNIYRLQVLDEQREDLSRALNDLWNAVLAGERRFKLYRQLKMYNDPSLNPVLYGRSESGTH